jgi:hypothetical protein
MTIGTAQMKTQAAAVTEVQAFMRKHGLTLTDLIAIGGAEFKSPNPKAREKARRVEKCWALMARHSVHYAHLESAPAVDTAKPARGRRGDGVFLQATENTDVPSIAVSPPESNEINELADFALVASLDSKTEPAS